MSLFWQDFSDQLDGYLSGGLSSDGFDEVDKIIESAKAREERLLDAFLRIWHEGDDHSVKIANEAIALLEDE